MAGVKVKKGLQCLITDPGKAKREMYTELCLLENMIFCVHGILPTNTILCMSVSRRHGPVQSMAWTKYLCSCRVDVLKSILTMKFPLKHAPRNQPFTIQLDRLQHRMLSVCPNILVFSSLGLLLQVMETLVSF